MCTTCKHVHISRRHEYIAMTLRRVVATRRGKRLQQLFQLNGKSAETED